MGVSCFCFLLFFFLLWFSFLLLFFVVVVCLGGFFGGGERGYICRDFNIIKIMQIILNTLCSIISN